MVLILHCIYKTQLYTISLAVGLDCDLYITTCYVFSLHMKGRAVEWAILDCTFVDWLFVRTCDRLQAIVCSRLPASVSAAGTGAKTEGWWGGSAADIPLPKRQDLALIAAGWHSSPFYSHTSTLTCNHCFLKDRNWGRLPVTVLFYVVTSWCLAVAIDPWLHTQQLWEALSNLQLIKSAQNCVELSIL